MTKTIEKKNKERLGLIQLIEVRIKPRRKKSFTGLILLISFDKIFAEKRSENAMTNFCGFISCPSANKIMQSGKDIK